MVREKINIGTLELKSRIVMPPMATGLSTEDGTVTDALLDFYSVRAENPNISMIITEHSYITMQGKARTGQMSIASDGDIEGLSRLTECIHKYGIKAVAQLNHAGSAAFSKVTGMEIVSASPVILPTSPMMGDGTVPKTLSKDEIKGIAEAFAFAASRAKKAGYDGVEIHSAHAYLLNQFYSPLSNYREDEYGGSLENRLRIHKEIIEAVRAEVGTDYLIALRLGGSDYMRGGSTIEDAVCAARLLESYGIDMLDLSGGMCRYTRKDHSEPGYFQDMSYAVRKAVEIPVMLTGGIKTIAEADKLLEDHAADLIGVGRELLKNAAWETE